MVGTQCSRGAVRGAITSIAEFCDLQGDLALCGIVPNEGRCLLSDGAGRAAFVDLEDCSRDQLRLSAGDRARIRLELEACVAKEAVRRRAAVIHAWDQRKARRVRA